MSRRIAMLACIVVSLCAFAPQAFAQATSTATVTNPAGLSDPTCNVTDPPCNSAADSDPILPSLTLVKSVVNDNGGSALASAWTLQATGPTSISGATGAVAVTGAAVQPGSYTLSESGGPAGYSASTYSCVVNAGAPVVSNSLTLAHGDIATCTITNDDIAATLTLAKNLINDNGGSATVASFPLTATGPVTITGVSGTPGVTNQSVPAGSYVLSEPAVAGYTAGPWTCTAGTLTGNTLVLPLGTPATCTITNDDQSASLALVKNVSGGPGVANNWTLSAAGPTPLSGAGGVTATPVNAGTYTLSETGGVANVTYTEGTWSCTGGTLTGNSLVLANGGSASCSITNTYQSPSVSVDKTVSPAGPVSVGDTLTFTVTTTVTTSMTTGVVTLSDTLGTGLTFGSVTSIGAYTCSGAWTCTLPVGTPPGTYSLTYTATVNASATGTVVNSVAASGIDSPTCMSCSTSTPVTPTAVSVTKGATGPATVVVGDTQTFVVTTTVANSQTTGVVTLTDTLGTGYTFGSVTSAGAYSCSGALTCTLPANTAPGTYGLTYTATVNASASGTVVNTVAASGSDNPSCTSCTTSTPVAASGVSVGKSVSGPASVVVGDTLTYTLTVAVVNSQATGVVTLADTLGTGLTFGSVTSSGAFSCSGALTCTLPANTAPGSYSLTYTATVNASATGAVVNSVVASGSDGPVCGTCSTSVPVAASGVTVAKAATGPATVVVGDTQTFTITTTVTNSQTLGVVTLTDTLGTGYTFGSVTSAGAYSCSGALTCTLPANTVPGTYALTYTATVNASATGTVVNSVAASGTDNPSCTSCTTSTPVTASSVGVAKSVAGPATVVVGDTLTYTLTTTVTNSQTTGVITLTDTLGTGLTFGSVTSAGAYACSGTLTCTLPANTTPGTYVLTYTATVDASASGTVVNNVVPSGSDGPVCGTCSTSVPVTASAVTVSKSTSAAAAVAVGDTVTYTVTTTITNSQTTGVVTLTDTLGTGLTFGSVTSAGAYSCSGTLTCTLPANTAPGTYAFTYTATVNPAATGSVVNGVSASGTNNPSCTSCTTSTPVAASGTTVVKSFSGPSPAAVGDTLTYTLTATVVSSQTTAPITLTDTFGTGLTFDSVTSTGVFSCGGTLTCVLPAGTVPGTYAVTYTATVNASATGSVSNSVVATGTENPTCPSCSPDVPVLAPGVTVTKSATGPATVAVGDTQSYEITATVANSQTTAAITLTDTLGTGLTFGSVTAAGAFTCTGALTCTLPAATPPGTYTLRYTASVNAAATGSVTNTVTATGADAPTCASCTTSTPVAASAGSIVKTVSGPAAVVVGDVLTYTVTATVTGSLLPEAVTLRDTPDAGLTIGAVTNPGAFTCTGALDCVLPAGTEPGTYTFTYTATVNDQATGTVTNAVSATGRRAPSCVTCTTSVPVVPTAVTLAKTSNAPALVRVGDVITYTITTTVANSKTTDVVALTDTLGTGLTFGAVTDAGAYTCTGTLTCTLPVDTAPGTYPLVYTATVNAQANGQVRNSVLATGAGTAGGATEIGADVAPAHVAMQKVADNPGPVGEGDVITYTLTATVTRSTTQTLATFTDTLGTGLDFVAVTTQSPAGAFTCNATNPLVCSLPIGTPPGTYSVRYTARVNGADVDQVTNSVTGAGVEVTCDPCVVTLPSRPADLRIAKHAMPSEVKLGDLVRYTVVVDNPGPASASGTRLVDTPPRGLVYVDDSLEVVDGDNAGALSNVAPLTVDGIDIAVGAQATITYLMRVGANAPAGALVNRAHMESNGKPVSATATAEVRLAADPILDESTILGSVFHDADGDGWQDEGEPGVPGVRIVSVTGLIVETDRFGRYHLAGMPPVQGGRGSNVILKIDTATLPADTTLTTDNPLVRRVTPGVPVRFDFGVRLPEAALGGGTSKGEEVQSVWFVGNTATIDPRHDAALASLADKLKANGGGEVVVTADALNEALAVARAEAVRAALLAKIPDPASKNVVVTVRTNAQVPNDLIAGLQGDGVQLGPLLFDTDQATIRPEYVPLLDRIARLLDAMRGGVVRIVGHADARGSDAHNAALGLARAQAVGQALSERLSPETRDRVRVDFGAKSAMPGTAAP